MMAPAVMADGTPNAFPMPIRAMPMVAMVVHELPVIRLTMEQMRQVLIKKNLGDMI